MHRAVKVAEYWNWLPAFRAVAETSSLRDAAKRIHVAPSAISRTIRLLEDALGHPLFDRTNGALSLNAAGRQLLRAVRAAMRTVDEAQPHDEERGPYHIHCPSDLVPMLVDVLATWTAAHPGAPPLVHVPCAEDVAAQLLRGDLDIAFAFAPATEAGLSSIVLGEVSSSVYCAPAHRTRALERLTDEDLATLPFVDFPVGDLSFLRLMRDPESQRVAYVPSMTLAAQLCARGVGLACLPDFVVESAGLSLVRLAHELPPARLFAWFRRPVGDGRPAIVEHVAAHPWLRHPVSERRSPTASRTRRRPG